MSKEIEDFMGKMKIRIKILFNTDTVSVIGVQYIVLPACLILFSFLAGSVTVKAAG